MLDHPYAKMAWLALASLAGAITALSFKPFRNMTPIEVGVSLFVGFSFALFVGPWAARIIFGNGPVDIRILGGMFYLMASGANVLIPWMVRKLGEMLGVKPEKEIE